nr:dehydrogenase, E1 component [Tanacetum cinerariifolium]
IRKRFPLLISYDQWFLEESDMASHTHATYSYYNTSSSPTVLVATNSTDNNVTMADSGDEQCRNYRRGSFTYGSRCKFVHGLHDTRSKLEPPSMKSAYVNKSVGNNSYGSSRSFQNVTKPSGNSCGQQEAISTQPTNDPNVKNIYIKVVLAQ